MNFTNANSTLAADVAKQFITNPVLIAVVVLVTLFNAIGLYRVLSTCRREKVNCLTALFHFLAWPATTVAEFAAWARGSSAMVVDEGVV